MFKNTPPTPKRKNRRGEIVKVSDLFDKYKTILKAPQGTVVKEFIEVVHDLTTIKIDRKYIKYSVTTKTISLTVPSALKQELALHREEILLHLTARLGSSQAPKLIM
jgi:dimeric dUTPase (all-alpha-NTP-PPase superfamily)